MGVVSTLVAGVDDVETGLGENGDDDVSSEVAVGISVTGDADGDTGGEAVDLHRLPINCSNFSKITLAFSRSFGALTSIHSSTQLSISGVTSSLDTLQHSLNFLCRCFTTGNGSMLSWKQPS